MKQPAENSPSEQIPFGEGFALFLPPGAEPDLFALQAAQKEAGSLFLPCERLSWNGKDAFLYLTAKLRPFPETAASLNAPAFYRIAAGLLNRLEILSGSGLFAPSGFLLTPDFLFLTSHDEPLLTSFPLLPSADASFSFTSAQFCGKVRDLLCSMQEAVPACSSCPGREAAFSLYLLLAEGRISLAEAARELALSAGEESGHHGSVRAGKKTAPASRASSSASGLPAETATPESLSPESLSPRGLPQESFSLRGFLSESGFSSGLASEGTVPYRLLLVPLTGEERQPLPVYELPCVLGKAGGGADLVLPGRLISRSHCRIAENGGRLSVCDMESTNGTFLNGKKLLPGMPEPLANGDVLKLAAAEYRLLTVREEAHV